MAPPVQRHLRSLVGAAVLAGAAGCYAPDIQDGTLACAGANHCPRGFVCRLPVRLCYRTQTDAAVAEIGAEGPRAGDAPETGGEVASDTRVEVAPDAGVEVAPDTGVDVARDTGVEVAPDTGVEVAPDTGVEVAPDAVTGDGQPDTRDVAPDVPAGDGGSESSTGNRGLGSPCDTGGQCASGACADGVCCQGACGGRCEACNLPENVGTCVPVAAGFPSPAGHAGCPTDVVESCDHDGTCDGNRGCRLRRAGSTCGAASCSGGTMTPAPTCDGLGQCQPSTPRLCAPYACDGNTACFDSCASNAQCQAPNSCAAGSCGPKSNGSPCTQSAECASGHCVDGICCNEACTERCKACDIAASPGTCVQVTSGQPHGARAACAGTGPCAGSCTSASATTCTFPGSDATCRLASCAGGVTTARAGCDGAGSCSPSATTPCGDLICNPGGTACLSTCTSDSQCATTARPYCDAGACVTGRPNGARCATAQECASQRCVDGYCCNASCALPCQACDVAGHAGTCWPVPNGLPYGGRPPCGGTDTCAGYCNNLSSGQCHFPGSNVACRCPGGVVGGTCNGMGACRTLGELCI